ncbi:MAG TPA: VOC family protein [Chloroflexota bacterium]|jgi:catechol 2,3-dioxygenase-like lactoylglutathione lyase family enzyme|nr:VOC family protein [Chloroflexota bacterium]
MNDNTESTPSGALEMVRALDHLYLETRSFDAAVSFWEALGFKLAERWGDAGHRAGRLVSGSASVVLAEGRAPAQVVHFRVPPGSLETLAASLDGNASLKVVTPVEATHWGTRWLRVQDNDRRIYALEETGS